MRTKAPDPPTPKPAALPDDLIRVSHAARLLGGLHVATLHRWIAKGKLRGWRVGGQWLISRADLESFAEPSQAPTKDPAPAKDPAPRRRGGDAKALVDARLRAFGVIVNPAE